jgi:large-conductance mechanosensitive channel
MNNLINIDKFLLFLNKFNIIPLAFSLIVSLNLNQISNSFIETIISPIINRLFNDSDLKLKDRNLIIFGIKFEIGQFLINLVQFIFTLIILYYAFILYEHVSHKNMNIPSKLPIVIP